MNLTIAVSSRDVETLVELTGVLDYASVPYLRQVADAGAVHNGPGGDGVIGDRGWICR